MAEGDGFGVPIPILFCAESLMQKDRMSKSKILFM
jgi:hypothetical protein